jgi:GNAT superfamily N-acetyltransferase
MKPEGRSISKFLEIRLYKPGDEAGIAKLFKEVFGREMSLDEWAWKYCERGKVYASVAKDETGNIVAHYGGMPKRMILNGREVSGLAIGDVMIHPKYRSFRLFKKIASMVPDEAEKDGFILGYGFPTQRALQLPEKLGLYEKVEDVFEATKAVGFANDIKRFTYKLFPLSFDDDRIGILWESVKDTLGLSVVRDSEYLERRYKRHPLFHYELWGLRKRLGSKLQGLAVLKREEGRMRIIDFVCPLPLLDVLIRKIENYASSAGTNELILWIPEYLKDRMVGMGFAVRNAETSIPRTTHEGGLTKNEIAGRFFYTMGDTDFL